VTLHRHKSRLSSQGVGPRIVPTRYVSVIADDLSRLTGQTRVRLLLDKCA